MAIARIESPRLDLAKARRAIAQLAGEVGDALAALGAAPVRHRIAAANRVLYDRYGFDGNRLAYDDIRNSVLSIVLERRRGIPITLAVIYMTVARRAGLEVFGVSFPGHFLMRVPPDAGEDLAGPVILDPFDRGRVLSRVDLERLLAEQAGDDTPWRDDLLVPCSSQQIAIRMLNNMKRLYVAGRCFAQAWETTDALVVLAPDDVEHLRDRGLLAYHMDRFPEALADLEAYVRATDTAREGSDQRSQIWEHITSLRRRVAGLN